MTPELAPCITQLITGEYYGAFELDQERHTMSQIRGTHDWSCCGREQPLGKHREAARPEKHAVHCWGRSSPLGSPAAYHARLADSGILWQRARRPGHASAPSHSGCALKAPHCTAPQLYVQEQSHSKGSLARTALIISTTRLCSDSSML